MPLEPAFEIGLWNAWILTVFFVLTGMIPAFLVSKERRNQMNRWPPYNKTEKILALSTHVIIMPGVAIYSIFLPLKLGTAWIYVGLPICFVAGVIAFIAYINIAKTPVDEPFTKGVYSISRHPLYLGGFLMYIGIGIACASWIVLLGALLWIVFWHIVVSTEERALVEKFGSTYSEYLKKTSRWIGIPGSRKN